MNNFITLLLGILLLVSSCSKDESVAAVKPSAFAFQYQATFKAYVYVWYYNNGSFTGRSYNFASEGDMGEALAGTKIPLDSSLTGDSVLIMFTNLASPRNFNIAASVFVNNALLQTATRTDTALYIKQRLR
jgi:hypothetical protein